MIFTAAELDRRDSTADIIERRTCICHNVWIRVDSNIPIFNISEQNSTDGSIFILGTNFKEEVIKRFGWRQLMLF